MHLNVNYYATMKFHCTFVFEEKTITEMTKANAEFENVVYHLTVHSIEELSFNDVL